MSDIIEQEAKLQIPEAERAHLIRLMRRAPQNHPLREIVDEETGEVRHTPDVAFRLSSILKLAPETQYEVRRVACVALRYVTVEADAAQDVAAALGATLHLGYQSKAAVASRRGFRAALRSGIWFAVSFSVLTLLFLFSIALGVEMLSVAIALIGLLTALLTPLFFLLSSYYDIRQSGKAREAAAWSLARLQLPQSVGALAKAARESDQSADVARNALLRLLPTLTKAHYGRIGADATPELGDLLTSVRPDTPFAEKILAAIGKVGDGRAAAPLEKLAARYANTPFGQQAEAILPLLRERREQENASAMLLRGSSAPPVEAGELLRAASQSAPTPPEMLLRPAPETPKPPSSSAA